MTDECPTYCPICGADETNVVDNAWSVPVRRCGSCRSQFVHPVPTEAELQARYAREHGEGKWAAVFDRPDERVWPERARDLVRLKGSTGRVLDVGCGDGRFLDAAESVGWSGVGVELAIDPLQSARLRLHAPRLVCGTLSSLRAVPSFDAVTFWDVLEHVPRPRELLVEAVARLRSGGLVVASMPNAEGLTARLHGRWWSYFDLAQYGHLHHLGPRGLTMLFEQAGLTVEEVSTGGSTDLRDVPEVRGWGSVPPLLGNGLDRISGLVYRVSRRARLANTLLVVGRR